MAEPVRLLQSRRLSEHVEALPAWQKASCVGLTMSMGSEISTSLLMEAARRSGKMILLPRVVGSHHMEFFVYSTSTQLVRSRFGVLEPVGEQPYDGCPDLLVVPGLAFSLQGDRLGYGGGFYDVWIAQHRSPQMVSVALALEWQVSDHPCWPVDEWDQRIDRIIT